MKKDDTKVLLYVPDRKRRLALFKRGTLCDAVLVVATFLLCVIASLHLLNLSAFQNISNWFHCGDGQNGSQLNVSNVKVKAPQCSVTFDTERFDCWPETNGASETSCRARGCCWDVNVGQGIPACYYPRDFANTYSISSSQNTSTGITATLSRSSKSPYPDDVMELSLDITFLDDQRLRIKIEDPKQTRYTVPIDLLNYNVNASNPDYYVTLADNPFSITVRRRSNGQILFDSAGVTPLIFADQYLQMGTRLATRNIYGLGEHRSSFRLSTMWTKFVFWARDQPPTLNDNLYGNHPFYLNLDEENDAHGVFLANSNAMEVDLQPHSGSAALTYRTIGGILDFYIFSGPSSDDVIKQYVSLIGKPYIPPFWALGYHLCKYGYDSADELKKVIKRNRDAGIPYDVQWNDIDYMSSHLDWTYDNNSYDGLPDIVKDLHDHNQKYVIIVDPGISSTESPGSYTPYDEGVVDDVFVKASDGKDLVGKVWPGETVFPDFFHPKAEDWWYRQAERYHQYIPFDGLWTDMNEPSNFVDGSTSGCTNSSLDNPPYVPPTMDGGTLHAKTLCPSANHHISSHYNLHSLYGFSEQRATMNVLTKLRNKRSIVISRSTFPSSGKYGGHWLGDNLSGWPDLYFSISGILNFQMFGVPLVGADICGFRSDTNPELCIRWTQLGAFYPFMRNHDSLKSKAQDPGSFDLEARSIMKSAIETRYTLLPYLYTLFYRSHVDGSPVARPIFFQYPGDAPDQDRQFLWGSSLLITSVLEEGATTVSAYIPNDVWYDFYNGSKLMQVGQDVVLDAPLSKINLHIRGGSIIPTKPSAVTTVDLRKEPMRLIMALSSAGKAEGELFWDDGESLNTVEDYDYSHVSFNMENNLLTNNVDQNTYNVGKELWLSEIVVYGYPYKPSSITVNGVSTAFKYDPETKKLDMFGISADLLKPLRVKWM